MQKKTIAIDMDDTLGSLLEPWVDAVNKGENENVVYTDIKTWDVGEYFKCGRKAYSYLTYDLFRNLVVFQDAVKVVEKLYDKYNVYIVSSATSTKSSLIAKIEWLEEHFPFIDSKHIVLCGDKSIIKADIMIDDGIHNLEAFEGETKILFNAPHNQHDMRFITVHNWKQVENFLL